MPLIRWCRVTLSLEDMSQMTATIRANNLRPRHTKCAIGMSRHRAWHCIEESGPSAAGLELVSGFVEGCVAGGAVVGSAAGEVFVVFAGEGGLGALFTDYFELLCDTSLVCILDVSGKER
jgi:hypothetical protein